MYSTLLEALFQIQDHKGADEELLGAWTVEHIREEHQVSSLSVSERHSVDRSLSSKDDTHTHRHTSSICAVLIYCLFGMWCGEQLQGPCCVSAVEALHCNHKGHPAAQQLEAATPLILSFEKILDAIKRAGATGSFYDVPSDLTKEFPMLLFKYLKAFKAWKVPDKAKLTNSIKHTLVTLYQAEESLPPDEQDDSKLR